MRRGLRFTEQMKGWLSFDETDFNQALLRGRAARTSGRLRLTIEIRDLDAFVDDRSEWASASGWFECDELGGRLAVESGKFQLFAREPDRRHLRMRYRAFLRDHLGQPLTLSGFKLVEDDPNFDSWRDVTTLFVRLFSGHLDPAPADLDEPGRHSDVLVATGVLRLTATAFARQLVSFRGQARSPISRGVAVARFQAFFMRELARAYLGPTVDHTRPSFPRDRRPPPGVGWHEVPGRPELSREIVPFTTEDRVQLNLHHLRRGNGPASGTPVLLSHGAGLRAQLFYGQPSGSSLAEALLDEGYDVWVENWRGSIDLPQRQYTLDRVARFDHPAAVRAVLERTDESRLKAVVHCQGSISFTMAAVAGLLPKVTHVVSSAVSLHVRVTPRSRVKQLVMLPVADALLPGADAQWSIRSPSLPAGGFAAVAGAIRRDCPNPVCAMASYMYGTGPDVLLRHENVEPEVHEWIGRELGYTPFPLINQLVESVGAGAIVPAEELTRLPRSYVDQAPRTNAAFTFIAGAENRMFLPEGQGLSFAHFDRHARGRHRLFVLDGFGHLDTLIGGAAAGEPFERILQGLDL